MSREYLVFDGLVPGVSTPQKLDQALYLYNGTTLTLLSPADVYTGGGIGGGGLQPFSITAYGDRVLFVGTDAAGDQDLWVSNGTSSGTVPIPVNGAETTPGEGFNPGYIAVVGDVAYTDGYDTSGRDELWEYNGTTVTELTVPDSNTATNTATPYAFGDGLEPENLTAADGKLFFYGLDSNGNEQVFVTVGTNTTVVTTGDLAAGGLSTVTFDQFVPFASGAIFTAEDATGHVGLFYSDGTAAGTTEISVGASDQGNSDFREFSGLEPTFSLANGAKAVLSYSGQSTTGQSDLWVTDGTAAGTSELTGIAGASTTIFDPSDLTEFNGAVYFAANDSSGVYGLWVTDGSAAGTHEITVAGAATPSSQDNGLSATNLTVADGKLYFEGYDSSGNLDLWSSNGTSAGTAVVAGTVGLSPDEITVGLTSTAPQTLPFDFSGTGQSDLLLQDTNGTIVIEAQAGLSITGGYDLGNPGATWHAIGSADFNGDGNPDILLQNTNGQIVDYLMNGTAIASGNYLGDPGAGWHVRGTGDFNGDGKADILLQNDDGSMVVWDTNGTSVTGTAYVGNPGPGWTVEGVADFNGDGHPDILVQNTSGALVIYTMNGSTIASGASLGNPGAGWSVAGTGDYNGDGKADILLHNDNGADVIWETNGSTVTGQVYVGNPGASYTGAVAGVDLNGDGSTDLVIQSTSSTLVGYTLNNNATITAGAVLGTPGAGWSAIGDNPVQYIDGTGSNANLTATPGADQFDLTSFAAGLHTIAGFDPAQDSVALSLATYGSYAGLQANEVAYQGGTFIALTPGSTGAAVVIQGVTPSQLSASNFAFR